MDMNLWKKDFMLIRKQFFVTTSVEFVLFLVMEIQFRGSIFSGLPLPVLTGLFTYMLTGRVFERDEKNMGACLMISAGYGRRQIIRNRFGFIASISFTFWFLCSVIHFIFSGFMFDKIIVSCSIAFFVSSLFIGAAVPFLSKYSYIKAQNAMTAMYFLIIIVFLFVGRYWDMLPQWMKGFIHMGPAGSVGVIGIGLVILGVGYVLSLMGYELREF